MSVVLFNVYFFVIFLLLGQQSLLVQLLSLNSVSLVFDLRGQLPANELLLVLGYLLREL
jgi:hypothetical protein